MGLKEEGESLARLALENGVRIDQLRKLHTLARSRPMEEVEAFIKYQTARIYGFPFGEKLLELLERHGSDIQKILEYAIMLYDYIDLKGFLDLKPEIRRIVDDKCRRYGLREVDLKVDQGKKTVVVALADYYGSPKELADQLKEEMLKKIPQASKHHFTIWIEKRR